MTDNPSFLEAFTTGLTYLLAVDDTHEAPHPHLDVLEQRLTLVRDLRREYGLGETVWSTMHSVRSGDPLAYAPPQPDAFAAPTLADLATLWREYLHQGLYVPTTGSGGRPHRRAVLTSFATTPRLTSQVNLIIDLDRTNHGRLDDMLDDLAQDLHVLQPLWYLHADRLEADDQALRLQVIARSPAQQQPLAREFVADVMTHAGLSPALITSMIDDPRAIRFDTTEPSATGPCSHPLRPRRHVSSSYTTDELMCTSFGIHATGELFAVDTADTASTLTTPGADGPLHVADLHHVARCAGWAA